MIWVNGGNNLVLNSDAHDTAQVLLIALTGYGQPEDAFQIKAAGFDYHLVKPASPEQLVALVGRQVSP